MDPYTPRPKGPFTVSESDRRRLIETANLTGTELGRRVEADRIPTGAEILQRQEDATYLRSRAGEPAFDRDVWNKCFDKALKALLLPRIPRRPSIPLDMGEPAGRGWRRFTNTYETGRGTMVMVTYARAHPGGLIEISAYPPRGRARGGFLRSQLRAALRTRQRTRAVLMPLRARYSITVSGFQMLSHSRARPEL